MDKDYPYVTDLITLATEMIDKADKINSRLVNCIIVLAISFCLCFAVTVVGYSYFYFTTDYNYGTNQTQINTNDSNQTTIKGGK
jgi:Sec-independent protein secretion pathway component TatC